MVGQRDGVGLGIGGGEAAALVAGAGDGAAEHSAGFEVEPGGEDRCLCGFELVGGECWG